MKCIDCNVEIPASLWKIRCLSCYRKNIKNDHGKPVKMPKCRYGANRSCYGEDCCCCEVYIESRGSGY
jgi:hypothetical protein